MSEVLQEFRAAISSRYIIERVIGRGGMATVYLAQDTRHRRAVALKVLQQDTLPSTTSERFHREIEIAARLNHPHILPLYDSGETAGFLYYVMPYADGGSLRGRLEQEKQLPISDAVEIARQVADALHCAHTSGVVHRDIKPENILLMGGHVLVGDFGIARALTQTGGGIPTTQTGVIVGTPSYMSPEQAAGQPDIASPSDVYALGCVLYEMLAGQPPFVGPTVESILRQHLVSKPPDVTALRPTTPTPLASVVGRALAKVPADRFRSAAEFLGALASGQSRAPRGAPGAKVMLAVLPLENFSGKPEEEYFSDGMTEELITHIARLSPLHLGVIARTTAMQYKRTHKSVAQIGAELGTDFALEGSARCSGERVRITVQLINVHDETHLWAETYDRNVGDVFAVQEEVAAKVAEMLEVKLLERASLPLEHETTDIPEAYDAYLKGQHLARSFFITKRPDDHDGASALFQRALALDPRFAKARGGLARLSFEHYRDYGDERSLDRAEAIARELLKAQPDSAAARATLASGDVEEPAG
jgi:serine/threonine-protein kinase